MITTMTPCNVRTTTPQSIHDLQGEGAGGKQGASEFPAWSQIEPNVTTCSFVTVDRTSPPATKPSPKQIWFHGVIYIENYNQLGDCQIKHMCTRLNIHDAHKQQSPEILTSLLMRNWWNGKKKGVLREDIYWKHFATVIVIFVRRSTQRHCILTEKCIAVASLYIHFTVLTHGSGHWQRRSSLKTIGFTKVGCILWRWCIRQGAGERRSLRNIGRHDMMYPDDFTPQRD
jgi:hypothetical protein